LSCSPLLAGIFLDRESAPGLNAQDIEMFKGISANRALPPSAPPPRSPVGKTIAECLVQDQLTRDRTWPFT
jgi:hypothetical protein